MSFFPRTLYHRIDHLERIVSRMATNLEQLNTEVSQLGPALDSLSTEVQALISQSSGVPQSTLDSVNNALAEISRIGANVTAATTSPNSPPSSAAQQPAPSDTTTP